MPQLGNAADGTRARHGGPHWHRPAARTGAAGSPAVGQGDEGVALSRDEDASDLYRWPGPSLLAAQASTGTYGAAGTARHGHDVG
jgi:hypothetical protein